MKKVNKLLVMLADDDEDDRRFFKEALEDTHIAVLITAKDGTELMYILRHLEKLPDAIFLDLNMPCMNGNECLKELKTNPKFNHIPVLIYSTSKSPAHIESTYKDGANLYITKPASIQKLRKMIADIITPQLSNYFLQPSKEKYVFAG